MTACAACGAGLPDEARFCPECGAPAGSGLPTEERKVATILFADLVGSTELGGTQDPERTRAFLDRFYDAMAEEVQAAGGTIEKFAGDAVMAVFGAPAAQEDHAERALHAALAMPRRLRELFGEEPALRIGVNTGAVVLGRAREGSSFVTGDAVNVAARLEQAAEPGEILAGERTVTAARGAFEFAEPATVEAKGKPEGVGCRRLVRALSLMRPRGVSGLRRVFVGREHELGQLQAGYERAVRERAPQLVSIIGDAGVGKTRVVRELWDRLGEEPTEPLRRTGRCLPYGEGITYWPLGEILKEHFGLLDSDPPEVALERLGDSRILGLTLGLDVAGDLHPLTARDRLQDAWTEFLRELAADRPVVVLIEDLHWAEEPLLELLEAVIRTLSGPVLLVSTARPELLDTRPAWGTIQNAQRILLEPLSPSDSTRMLDELLASDLPAELRAVVARAEGNPFFVEELLGMLIDRGVLQRENDGWVAQELPAGFAVPDSVQAVLAARIDLLGPAEKAALQAASVIGRVFWTGPVYELVSGLEPDFAVLEDRDFVRRRSGSSLAGEREFAIKHALTREVAYETLPKATRAHLHAAFAQWLERTGEGRDEHAALLAHHFAEAVRPEDADLAWAAEQEKIGPLREKAVTWLRRAAELALGRYEIDDGLAMLQRILEVGTDPDDFDLWQSIAHAHVLKYDGEAFWTTMQRALELSPDASTRGELYAELSYQTATRSGMWKHMPEPDLVDGWIEKALELAEPESSAHVKALIARARWTPDDFPDAAIEASAIAERLGDPELRSNAWDVRGISAFVTGEYELGRAWAERRFELVDQISDPDLLADIHAAPITGTIWNGHFREARRLAGEHDRIASRLTPHHGVHAIAILVEVEELAGGWEAILQLQDRAESAVAANHATPCVRNPRTLLVCAAANAYLGNEAAAETLEKQADEIRMEGYGATLDTPRVRLALARGDLAETERLIAGQVESRGWHRGWFIFANNAARLDGLSALGNRARIEDEAASHLRPGKYLEPFALRALGVVREDDGLVVQAAARFAAMNLDWHAAQTRALLD